MRADVLASKGILASDPSVQSMTQVQWYFEFAALKRAERRQIELGLKLFKSTMISLLGLNRLKPTREDGTTKSVEELTQEEKESYLPLVMWTAHPELLKKVSEQLDEEAAIDTAQSDKDYEKLVEAIDAMDGDMDPILGVDPGEAAARAAEKVRLAKETEKTLVPDRRDIKVDI